MNYSRPQFRLQGQKTTQWDEDEAIKPAKPARDRVWMIRCKTCGKLGQQPPGNLWRKTLRCTRCGQRQSLIEMIEAAK
jgi:rRNA maturation endonuclease Nob1